MCCWFCASFSWLKSALKQKVINLFTNRKIKINNIINVYASDSMVFEGQDNKLIEEANYCKKNKYFGYKFRLLIPNNLIIII